jgi:hypothetical protein
MSKQVSKWFSFFIASLLLMNCSQVETINSKAIVLLIGDLEREMFGGQKAVIAFKDNQDSVYIENVVLPKFSKPAFVGDSIDIVVSSDNIEFEKLYKYKHKPNDRFLYVRKDKYISREALFNNGVLVFIDYGLNNSIEQMQFYNFKSLNSYELMVSPIGFPNEEAFKILGDLGQDTIVVDEFGEAYTRKNTQIIYK